MNQLAGDDTTQTGAKQEVILRQLRRSVVLPVVLLGWHTLTGIRILKIKPFLPLLPACLLWKLRSGLTKPDAVSCSRVSCSRELVAESKWSQASAAHQR